MKTVSVTRMELLARKAQIALAQQGSELLEQKRVALMKELMRVADVVMEEMDVLQARAEAARRALARAQATAGNESVRSAALAARADLPIRVTTTNVMGVRVPIFEQRRVSRPMVERGYSLVRTPITIDEAAASFEAEVDAMINLAENELRLRRLAGEIQRTSRRKNALDNLLIPRLESERDYILMALEERERSDRFRLKLAKRLLSRKKGGPDQR